MQVPKCQQTVMGDEKKPTVFVEEYSGVPVQSYRTIFHLPEALTTAGIRSGFVHSLKQFFVTVFLPQGYPYTVSEDYLEYQCWDTIQAFASSLNGALATSAVLKGVGVGRQEATVLAASLTWLIKDGTGMVGRILFAWKKGGELDSNNKKWRLVADILNDLAFVLDILASHFSQVFFAPMSCVSSSLRAIVGVAGGGTKTVVTRHQAIRENLADVAAKDGSQETLVNIISLVVSLIMLPVVDSKPILTWLFSMLFTFVHIYANYRAVRTLKFNTLNQKRVSICVRQYTEIKTVPSIEEANDEEPLFWNVGSKKKFGCTLRDVIRVDKQVQTTTLEPKHGRWMASYVPGRKSSFVALRVDATTADQLDSAFAVEYRHYAGDWPSSQILNDFKEKMLAERWDLSFGQLQVDEWRFREKSD